MKHFSLILFLLSLNFCFGQNYAPFNGNNPKRFVNPIDVTDNDYFFYSRLNDTIADTIVFSQYLRKSSFLVDVNSSPCPTWGGSMQPSADTTWLGRTMKYNTTTEELLLQNTSSESLNFDFGIALNDSSSFYQEMGEQYFIRYDNLAQELIIDSLNWVKTYTVWKYDGSGNLLPSSLNGFEIKLSESLGLSSFINCSDFPNLEQGLDLMGQLYPTIGYYQLTFDEVYPWDVGDTIEVQGSNTISTWGVGTVSHKVITIQNRVETADSVWIYLDVNEQIDHSPSGAPSYPGAFNISYPNPIKYKKKDNINAYPHNTTANQTLYINDSVDYCGMRGRFQSFGEFNYYCDSCDCFTPFDGNGATIITREYLEGLGKTHINIQQYGNFNDFTTASIIYSNVGGVQCGTYIPLAIHELKLNDKHELLKIIDITGRETEFRPNTSLIYIYTDGTTQKVFSVE